MTLFILPYILFTKLLGCIFTTNMIISLYSDLQSSVILMLYLCVFDIFSPESYRAKIVEHGHYKCSIIKAVYTYIFFTSFFVQIFAIILIVVFCLSDFGSALGESSLFDCRRLNSSLLKCILHLNDYKCIMGHGFASAAASLFKNYNC